MNDQGMPAADAAHLRAMGENAGWPIAETAANALPGKTTTELCDRLRGRASDGHEMKVESRHPQLRSLCRIVLVLLLCTLAGCYGKPEAPKNESRGAASPSVDARTIIDRYRGLDNSNNSTAKLKVTIQESSGDAREFGLTMISKREPDGAQILLVEFAAPKEERDRSSLIKISPHGEIEATRYAQSTDGFVSTRGSTSEDSLFGMSLQEMAGGQPEKYDFSVAGEDTVNSSPVYRLEGKIREGEESKFPRVVFLIAKDTFAALVAEFYDKNRLARRITVNRLEQINGIPTRMHWTIDNIDRQKKIDFEASSVAYNQKLSDSILTRENLKKISMK
jgi:hypothetical protein